MADEITTSAIAWSSLTRAMSAPALAPLPASDPGACKALWEFGLDITLAARRRVNSLINNSSPVHFNIAMVQLFALARREVRVYSTHLTRYARIGNAGKGDGRPVWAGDPIVTAAKHFLGRDGSRLEIIVRSELDCDGNDPSTHPLLQAIIADPARRGVVSLRIANGGQNVALDRKMFAQNFVVADGIAYRHELNGDGIRAVVQFGDSKSAGLFARSFDKMAGEIDRQVLSAVPGPVFAGFYVEAPGKVSDPLALTPEIVAFSQQVIGLPDPLSSADAPRADAQAA